LCVLCASAAPPYLLLAALNVVAWSQPATGAINGRVVAEDGQPMPRATVNLTASGKMNRRVSVSTDEEGNFRADGLDAAAYDVSAIAPGYIARPPQRTGAAARQTRFNYIGDFVTVTMIKGGVITGRVMNSAGEPIIGIPVVAERVRDEDGRLLPAPVKVGAVMQWRTDDRGVYRCYGLAPGSYIVGAGGSGISTRPTPFDGRMLTYYTSATRDTATEAPVRAGEELTGIDIRYRSERGYIISGKITGLPPTGGATQVILRKAGSDLVIATTSAGQQEIENGYAIYGAPNGEYEIIAARDSSYDDNAFASSPRRVSVNGRDVGGIDLALTPLAILAGGVVTEKAGAARKCEAARDWRLNEVVVRALRDEPGEKSDAPPSPYWSPPAGDVAENGTFSIRGLKAGRYRLEPMAPGADWYVKEIKLSAAPAAASDLARNGVTLKSGQRQAGALITLGAGAAGLKGKVVADGGARLPARMRAHLAPAEPEAKDQALRFVEASVESDGAFSVSNLPPGKYWLLTRPAPEDPSGNSVRPAAWDAAERARLRREAEAAKIMIELKPCQQLSDYKLHYNK
ncbi:MAG TPA: carboxypeptidase-like regulatory domain-containing protein, partial [Blastocatellia bacterium]|nr:carboxypeptidase-like regulatory domain-containing protein [Blastocatellia bacterium]